MPLLKHAKKKLRQDKIRAARNKKLKELFKKLVKEARNKKTKEAISKAFSGIDKAAKNHIIHKNTAARIKSSLSKSSTGSKASSESKTTNKKIAAKKPKPKSALKTKKTSK